MTSNSILSLLTSMAKFQSRRLLKLSKTALKEWSGRKFRLNSCLRCSGKRTSLVLLCQNPPASSQLSPRCTSSRLLLATMEKISRFPTTFNSHQRLKTSLQASQGPIPLSILLCLSQRQLASLNFRLTRRAFLQFSERRPGFQSCRPQFMTTAKLSRWAKCRSL